MQRAAVIGGGLMGHGIAQVLALGGLDVVVHDPVPEALEAVPRRIAENLEALGIESELSVELQPDLETAASRADWVFEAAPEDLPLKQEIFERIDKAAPATAVLATNTSVMRMGDIASRARGKRRILGTHWWNPPFLVPLVEVVQGPETDPTVIERMMSLLDSLGKTPVHVRRDVAGFVGNRLQHALWREAFDLVDKGVCDASTCYPTSIHRRSHLQACAGGSPPESSGCRPARAFAAGPRTRPPPCASACSRAWPLRIKPRTE